MKVVIAPDSFKGCLTSYEVCTAISKGILKFNSETEIVQIPSSDGGEGFCDSMKIIFGGEVIGLNVTYPLGEKGRAEYIYNRTTHTAYIEFASAAGLALVPENKRDIMSATSYGVGELIADAITKGAETIVVGLGGSATNDCGIGILSALGIIFFDEFGNRLPATPSSLSKIKSVDKSKMKDISHVSFVVACDVNNPLCGKNGAAEVFSRQKGANDEQVKLLDKGAKSFAKAFGIDPD